MTAVERKPRPAVSRAKMERAAKALHHAGIPFQGFRLHPDGSVDVLAGEPLTITTKTSESPEDAMDRLLAEFRQENGYS